MINVTGIFGWTQNCDLKKGFDKKKWLKFRHRDPPVTTGFLARMDGLQFRVCTEKCNTVVKQRYGLPCCSPAYCSILTVAEYVRKIVEY